jgi:hypothetical protein
MQGSIMKIPFYAFLIAVMLPFLGMIVAEILIWWKNRNRYR